MHLQQVALETQDAAVKLAPHPQQVGRIEVAARAEQLQQHARLTGDHHEPGGGRRQRERAAPRGMADRELLRRSTSPGHAEHVDALDAQVVEQLGRQASDMGHPVGQKRRGRLADARDVEGDHARSPEARDERRRGLDAGADAVEQQQGARRTG